MSYKVAEEDIVRKNAAGQNVVVVPAGQPIPEGFDSASTGLRMSEALPNGISDGMTAPPVLDQAIAEGNGTEILGAPVEEVEAEPVEEVDKVEVEPVEPIEDATPVEKTEEVEAEPKAKRSRGRKVV